MDRTRIVVFLDVYKDCIYHCIMRDGEFTMKLRQICDDILDHGVSEDANYCIIF